MGRYQTAALVVNQRMRDLEGTSDGRAFAVASATGTRSGTPQVVGEMPLARPGDVA